MRKAIGISLVIAAVAVSTVLLIGKNIEKMPSKEQGDELAAQPVPVLEGSYNKAFLDLDTMVSKTEIIVIGRIDGVAGTRNMARDPNDPTRPDPNHQVIGLDYKVQVERYLKGTGTPELLVTQPQFSVTESGEKVTYGSYVDMETGGRYLLFIRQSLDGSGRFVGAGEPWRFSLGSGRARIQSNEHAFQEKFPDLTETELVGRVQAAIKPRN